MTTPPIYTGDSEFYVLTLQIQDMGEYTVGHYAPLSEGYTRLHRGRKVLVNEGGHWLDQDVWVPKYREFMQALNMLRARKMTSIELPICQARIRTGERNYVFAPTTDTDIWRAIVTNHKFNVVFGEISTVDTVARTFSAIKDKAPRYEWPKSGLTGPTYHEVHRISQRDFLTKTLPSAPQEESYRCWAGEWIDDDVWAPKFDAFMTALETVAAGLSESVQAGDVRVTAATDHYELGVPENETSIWDHIVRQKKLNVVITQNS